VILIRRREKPIRGQRSRQYTGILRRIVCNIYLSKPLTTPPPPPPPPKLEQENPAIKSPILVEHKGCVVYFTIEVVFFLAPFQVLSGVSFKHLRNFNQRLLPRNEMYFLCYCAVRRREQCWRFFPVRTASVSSSQSR